MRGLVLMGLFLVGGQAIANPPTPLLELTSKRPGSTDAPQLVVRITADGRFRTESAMGTIPAAKLAAFEARLTEARFVMAASFSACDALATEHLDLTTTRGHLEWEEPCQPVPDPSILRLLEAARAVIPERAKPGAPMPGFMPGAKPLVELLERGEPGGAPKRVFLLASDGKFEYLGRTGAIEEAELGVLALDLSRAVFVRGPGPACDATGSAYTIKTTRGTLEWQVPCASTPHPTVQTLVDHIHRTLHEELDRPPILVEIVRTENGVRRVELTIEDSGAWHRGDQHGVIADQKELRRLIKEARFATPVVCTGPITRELWTWPRRTCLSNSPAHPIATLAEQLTQKGTPILVTLERAVGKGPFIPRILVFTNGVFVANDIVGKLDARELAAWKKQVAAARFVLVPPQGGSGMCVKQPSTYRVRSARGKVDHRSCENPPHPTVATLEAQLQELRERDPRTLRLLVVDVQPKRQELILDDGTLLAEGMPKRIHPSNVSSLGGQIMGTTFAATRNGDCTAPQIAHLVESAGHGHLLWTEPCETPDPSVRALEDRAAVLRK